MARLLLIAFSKLLFLVAPIVAVIFTIVYFLDRFLIEHGLKYLLSLPAAAAIAISLLSFHLIVGSTMAEIKKLHQANKRGADL
jgi:hypothetical protein